MKKIAVITGVLVLLIVVLTSCGVTNETTNNCSTLTPCVSTVDTGASSNGTTHPSDTTSAITAKPYDTTHDGNEAVDIPGTEKDDSDDEIPGNSTEVSGGDFSFTDRDAKTDYDESKAIDITLKGNTVSISAEGKGAMVQGTTVTLTDEGTYLFRGALENGRIVIAAEKTDKLQLILDGVSIKSSDGPCLFVSSCDKLFLTLAENSDNRLEDASLYTFTDPETTPDGVLYSREDITINAQSGGKLSIKGNYKHGIVSKDDLVITSGAITVDCPNVALSGKDCVKIGGGTLTLRAGSDAIRSENGDDLTKGFVYIANGTLELAAGNDGVQAETTIRIAGGKLSVTAGGGAGTSSSQYNGEESMKGLKAGGLVEIVGGTVTLNCKDDGVHSNNAFVMANGSLTVTSSDDGIHADESLRVSGGELTVDKSYEGLESKTIEIAGGKIFLTASDDGINASSGSSNGKDFGGMWGGGGGMQADSSCLALISGGYLYVNASGDGLDSNGILKVTGGTILVAGPTNSGNGALDYGSSAEVTGGTLIALGASGMASNFREGTVGSVLLSFSNQTAGKSFAVVDSEGRVIASFMPPKSYSSAVIVSPSFTVGESYSIVIGATLEDADANGFGEGGSIEGGTVLTSFTMTSLIMGSQGGNGPGGGRPPRPR